MQINDDDDDDIRSLTLSCKLVEVFAMICGVCFATKSSPRFRRTLALNPAFSVAPVESPRYGSRRCDGLQSPLRTAPEYNLCVSLVCYPRLSRAQLGLGFY